MLDDMIKATEFSEDFLELTPPPSKEVLWVCSIVEISVAVDWSWYICLKLKCRPRSASNMKGREVYFCLAFVMLCMAINYRTLSRASVSLPFASLCGGRMSILMLKRHI